ncbi:MAG: hypothetical protein JSV92_00210 [archaeon]|nr:MAG: hypothetical protein JSV92_00210 [archaeon]
MKKAKSRKKTKERKTEMYLCGEKYSSQYRLKSDYLFDSILKFFGLERLRKAHSGDLSTYLYWLVLGAVAIIILLLVMV